MTSSKWLPIDKEPHSVWPFHDRYHARQIASKDVFRAQRDCLNNGASLSQVDLGVGW